MIRDCEILENSVLKNDYMRIRFSAPEICREAGPGQFVHIQIPALGEHILRRPFSICSYEDDVLTVVYKIVGAGTARLAEVRPGTRCSVMGPLGSTFPALKAGETAVIVAGGYGAAATLPVAQTAGEKSILLLGARSEKDILLTADYERCGSMVFTATQDGSHGVKGLVTDLLPQALARAEKPVIFACGPNGMLMALGKIALAKKIPAFLSLDHPMCCGVGACFACVVKVKSPESPDGWRYSRSCTEGPVYPAEEVWYE